MTKLRESVDKFHATITIVEAAIRLTTPYDFVRDPQKVVAAFEASWTALKAAAREGMNGGGIREDVRSMLAENANRYRDCSRLIAEARDPKIAAKRKKTATATRREFDVERFVVAEAQQYWQRDAAQRRH